jgi:hypothetical protein
MNNPVAKISRKNFPWLGFSNNKADKRFWNEKIFAGVFTLSKSL